MDGDAEIVTTAITFGFTVIVIVLDKTVEFVKQVALETISQVILSPFSREELVYAVLFVPVFTPFNFH